MPLNADQLMTLAMIRATADGQPRTRERIAILANTHLADALAAFMGDNETLKEATKQDWERLAAQYEEHAEHPWIGPDPGVG